jgi:hypothetical protein
MNIDHIEIILLMDRSEGEVSGAPPIEDDPNLFAVNAGVDCLLIGAISNQSQAKSDMKGGNNYRIQRGTHSAPCSFNDAIELFGPDLSKLRLMNASVATFKSDRQFEIPRTGERGFIVEAKVDLPNVGIFGLNGKFTDWLLTLIAIEAVAGVTQPNDSIH